MEITVKNAILHIMNNAGDSVLSKSELDIDSEVCHDFIVKHVKKLLSNNAAKEATFNADSPVCGLIRQFQEDKLRFTPMATAIGEHLQGIMQKHPAIPAGDLLIAFCDIKGPHMAILKLHYKECMTHQVRGQQSQLVKYEAVLPDKVEEACLIPFDPMLLRVIEKPLEIDGEMVSYFSALFLGCEASLSKKEAVQIISDVTEEINERFFSGSPKMEALVKAALVDEAEEAEGVVSLEKVAAKAFEGRQEIQQEYLALAREAGLVADYPMGEKLAKQSFGVQKIKCENGIEISIPTYLMDDEDAVAFELNDDGTSRLVIKRVQRA